MSITLNNYSAGSTMYSGNKKTAVYQVDFETTGVHRELMEKQNENTYMDLLR